jgi:hypothetical protein
MRRTARMALAGVVAAWTVLAAGPAAAGIICDTVAALHPFSMIGTQKVRARPGSPLPEYCAFGLWWKGCTGSHS